MNTDNDSSLKYSFTKARNIRLNLSCMVAITARKQKQRCLFIVSATECNVTNRLWE
jgi:hypothetical protein